MLENPPTFEERWRARITAAACAFVTFLVLIWVQWKVLFFNFYAGTGLAPIWNFGAYQAVSHLLTGRYFGLRLDPRAKTADEVLDLLFTVAFVFTLVTGLYAAYDAWTYVAPSV